MPCDTLFYSHPSPPLTLFSHPLSLGNNWSDLILSFSECYVNKVIQTITFWDCLFLVLFPWEPSKLLHILIVCYSFLLSSIPWCGYTIFCLNIHPSKNICCKFLAITNKSRCEHLYTYFCVDISFPVSDIFFEHINWCTSSSSEGNE